MIDPTLKPIVAGGSAELITEPVTSEGSHRLPSLPLTQPPGSG